MLRPCHAALFILAILAGYSRAADEPAKKPAPDKSDWPSFRGNPDLAGIAPAKLPEKLTQLWKFDAGEGIDATAAIVGDRVYIPTLKARLLALKLADGVLLWKFKTKGAIFASPCVADGRIFVGDENGMFYAVDASTGKELWSLKARDKFISSAIVEGDNVLVGNYDRRLFCLDAATGKIRWSFKADAQVHCSPALLHQDEKTAVVIVGCDAKLRVIDLKTGKEQAQVAAEDACAASPAIYKDHAYFGNLRGDILAIDLKKNALEWKIPYDNPDQPTGTITASAAVNDDAAFFATQDNRVLKVARLTGKIQWTFATKGSVESSPVLVENRLYFGDSDGTLHGLGADTGKELWKFVAGGEIHASPAVAHQRLVIANSQGAIYCFGP